MTYAKTNKLHIVAVVAVMRNTKGQYLVLKRSEREIAYPGQYTFPGGKVEDNDTVEETLRKEVREEAGLTLKPGKVLLKDKSFIRPDGQTVKVFSYWCEVEDDTHVTVSDDFTDFRWVTLADLATISHVGIEGELQKAEQLVRQGLSPQQLATESVQTP